MRKSRLIAAAAVVLIALTAAASARKRHHSTDTGNTLGACILTYPEQRSECVQGMTQAACSKIKGLLEHEAKASWIPGNCPRKL